MENELPAGGELDALVATRVMNWKCHNVYYQGDKNWNCENYGKPCLDHCPEYSTSIEAAWTVVQKLLPRIITLRWCDGWEVNEYLPDEKETVLLGEAQEAPLAICRASLAAVDAMEEEK